MGDFHCYEAERTEDILGSAYTAHKSATVATSRDKVVDDEGGRESCDVRSFLFAMEQD